MNLESSRQRCGAEGARLAHRNECGTRKSLDQNQPSLCTNVPSGQGGSLKVYREGVPSELLDFMSSWVRSPLRAVFPSLDALFVSNGVTA